MISNTQAVSILQALTDGHSEAMENLAAGQLSREYTQQWHSVMVSYSKTLRNHLHRCLAAPCASKDGIDFNPWR